MLGCSSCLRNLQNDFPPSTVLVSFAIFELALFTHFKVFFFIKSKRKFLVAKCLLKQILSSRVMRFSIMHKTDNQLIKILFFPYFLKSQFSEKQAFTVHTLFTSKVKSSGKERHQNIYIKADQCSYMVSGSAHSGQASSRLWRAEEAVFWKAGPMFFRLFLRLFSFLRLLSLLPPAFQIFPSF